jgi:hypothetical protein
MLSALRRQRMARMIHLSSMGGSPSNLKMDESYPLSPPSFCLIPDVSQATRMMHKVNKRYKIDQKYDTSAGVDLGVTVGGQAFQSLGTVSLRWYAEKLHMRYEDGICHVVNSEDFDLIIGRPDIIKLGLLQLRRRPIVRVSAFFAPRPKVEGSSSPLVSMHIFDSSKQSTPSLNKTMQLRLLGPEKRRTKRAVKRRKRRRQNVIKLGMPFRARFLVHGLISPPVSTRRTLRAYPQVLDDL